MVAPRSRCDSFSPFEAIWGEGGGEGVTEGRSSQDPAPSPQPSPLRGEGADRVMSERSGLQPGRDGLSLQQDVRGEEVDVARNVPAGSLRLLTAAFGTSVWTGRVLQAGRDDLEITGLAHLYSAL